MGECSHVHSSHEDQQISYSFSLCHLGVPDNRVILCCHMLQLHKTNNLCTNYKDHKEAGEHKNCNISFTCSQHKGGNRPSVETPFHIIPEGFVYLSARAGNITAGKGISTNCGSAPGREADWSLTLARLWLWFSKALMSH